MRGRLMTAFPFLLALLPWAWVLAPLLEHNRFYVSEDTVTVQASYPLHHLLGTSMQEGRLPLWTPLISNGYPLMAEGSTGAMYPLNLFLFRYFSPYNAYQIAMALAPLFSLVTAYYYLRHRRHSLVAALLGSSCFAMGGYTLGHLRHLNHLQAMSMLPLALMFGERYLERRRLSEAVLAGSALAVAILAGTAQIPYLIGVGLVLLVLSGGAAPPDPGALVGTPIRGLERPVWRLGHALLLLPVAGVLAALLAAPQILLSWDLLPVTRPFAGLGEEGLREGSLGFAQLLHFVAPHAHGIPAAGTYTLEGRYWETLGYLGAVPLVLAALAPLPLWRGDRRALFPLALSGVGLALASGVHTPLFALARDMLPGVAWFPFPGRFLLLAQLGLAMLAALGLDFLIELLETHPHPLGQRFAAVLPLFALATTAVDLGEHGSALLAWTEQATLLRAPPTMAAIPKLGPYRLLSLPGGGTRVREEGAAQPPDLRTDPEPFLERRALLRRNFNMRFDVNAVGADVALPIDRYRALEERLQAGLEPDGRGGLEVSPAAFNLMNFFGVRLVLSYFHLSGGQFVPLEEVEVPGVKPSIKPYGIEDPFPKAYLARNLKRCGAGVALARIEAGHFGSGWDPCREGTGTEGAEPEESSGVAGYLKMSARGDTFVEYTVNLLNPGYLVVRESWAPGWISKVDALEAETVPVDLIYRATPVPKGKHKVRQEYRPRGMGLGLGLNMLGLIAVTTSLLASRAQGQRVDPFSGEWDPPPREMDPWFR